MNKIKLTATLYESNKIHWRIYYVLPKSLNDLTLYLVNVDNILCCSQNTLYIFPNTYMKPWPNVDKKGHIEFTVSVKLLILNGSA